MRMLAADHPHADMQHAVSAWCMQSVMILIHEQLILGFRELDDPYLF